MENNYRFSFGENWKTYNQKELDEDRINEAIKSLKSFLDIEDLNNKSFLDIGCGSGLFSLAAYRLGASNVYSFDYDQKSVECCSFLWEKEGRPQNWVIGQGSILDREYIKSRPKTDIVYSWGVLHHTGKMWEAISNASSLVKQDGLFFIAIYNKRERNILSSDFWLKIKLFYNSGKKFRKIFLEFSVAGLLFFILLSHFRNPIKYIREYKKQRGMSWWRDVVDWVGGYPYEFATAEEIFMYCHAKLGLQLENLKLRRDIGCNEFVFKKY